MSTPTSDRALRLAAAAIAPLLLAACGSGAPPEVAEGGEHVACAVGGAKDMRPVCAVEREQRDGALFLVVRHPDGGFRRFEVLRDGRGLAAAEGADPAKVTLSGSTIEVEVAGDLYRFPVTVKTDAAQP